MEKKDTEEKAKRPTIIFVANESVVEDLIRNSVLHQELRRDGTLDFGFRYCHRYKKVSSNIEKKENYFLIIHDDIFDSPSYWKEFIESVRGHTRVLIIATPASKLTTDVFIEALNTFRKKFPHLTKEILSENS